MDESIVHPFNMRNWDACVTRTFDVQIGPDFGSTINYVNTDQTDPVASASAKVGFSKYWLGGFLFSVPMQNLSPTLGEGTFTGSGTDGPVSGSAQAHFVIKHTPK